MPVTLYISDAGDHSVGIPSNKAEITLELDGSTQDETAENIQYAKEVLSEAMAKIWDSGSVSVMTSHELQAMNIAN